MAKSTFSIVPAGRSIGGGKLWHGKDGNGNVVGYIRKTVCLGFAIHAGPNVECVAFRDCLKQAKSLLTLLASD